MKKNRGFTFVELLAVITIIGVLALIALPTIEKITKENKEKIYQTQLDNIILSLKNWASDNRIYLPEKDGEILTITLGNLKSDGYIEYDIKNPKNNKCFSNEMALKITKVNNNYNYSIDLDTINESELCEVDMDNPIIILNGNSVENVEINSVYVDKGVSAKDKDGNDITSKVISNITGSSNVVDTSKLNSQYTIAYSVTSNNKTSQIFRTVKIVDTTEPIITIPGNTLIKASTNTIDLMDGVSATDNSGETITVSVKSNISFSIPGKYIITYSAQDSSGNTTTIKRLVTVTPVYTVVYEGITNNGYQSKIDEGETLNISFTNNIPNRLNVYINDTEIPRSSYTYKNGTLTLNNVSGNVRVVNGVSTLVSGENFNKAIKNLVNGTTDATADTVDTAITSIAFYEETFPTGHNIYTLNALPNVSVSSDNRIKAYNDNGKVYVYSDNDIVSQQMGSMFKNIQAVTTIDILEIDTSNNRSADKMFWGAHSLETLDLSNFNTSNVGSIYFMFYNCKSIESLDLSNFDTSKVSGQYTFEGMFYGMESLKTLDLSSFDTSKITHMQQLFYNCTNLESINLSGFDTSNVTKMEAMFRGCESLKELDLSSFNVSNVTNMHEMFARTYSLSKLDLSSFNTSNVENMGYMFFLTGQNAKNISLNLGENFDTSNVNNMFNMFNGVGYYSDAVSINLGNKFDTNSVEDMSYMFRDAGWYAKNFVLDLGDKFTFSSATTTEFSLHNGATKLIIPATVTNIPDGTFKEMFKLNEIIFEHSSTDAITLPTAGETTGAFYHSSNINTTVTTTNDTIKNYDWLSDNRTVTFN